MGILDGLDADTLMKALTNPAVNALMGMSQGFAQAAMPSRMPVPTGAAIGMGLGGALPGVAQGIDLRQKAIANQFTENQLSAMKAAGMMNGGAPFGAPMSGGGVVGQASDGSQPLISPQRAAMMAQIMGMNPATHSSAGSWLDMYKTSMPAGGGSYVDQTGAVRPVPGALAFEGAREFAKKSGEKGAESPYVAPQTFDVPDYNPDGTPKLDASGNPMFRKQLMTVPQANSYAGGNGAAAQSGQTSQADPAAHYQAVQAALASIKNPALQKAAINSIFANKIPLEAQAPFIAGIHHESGWNPNVPNGTSGEIGLGQIMPGTGKGLGYTEDQLRDPAKNVMAAGKYFMQKWGESGGDIPRTYAGYNTGTVNGKPTDGYLQNTSRLLQGYGYPMPGRVPPGVGGTPVLTPRQEADLKVKTAMRMPVEVRHDTMSIRPESGEVWKNPSLIKVTNPDGTVTEGHAYPPSPLDPNSSGHFDPLYQVNSDGTKTPIGNAVPPDQQKARDAVVKEFLGKDQDSYLAAKNTQGWLKQIDHAADVMNKEKGWYQTGPFAPERYAFMGGVNDFMRTLSLKEPFKPPTIAVAEEMKKAQTTAGFELASHYEGHAKQAAQTIMSATSAVPGYANSPEGLKLVSAGINETAQSAADAHEYKAARYNGDDPHGLNRSMAGKKAGAGLETAEVDFYKKYTPELYAKRAISTVEPVKLKSLDQAEFNREQAKYLPGTVMQFPDGVKMVVPPRAGAPGIPGYITDRLNGGANAGR